MPAEFWNSSGREFCSKICQFGVAFTNSVSMSARVYKLLLVDDSQDHRVLFGDGLRATGVCDIIAEAENGEVAIHYLTGADGYANREAFPLPDVILLDLSMPRMNGFEVLKWLQARRLHRVITIVLSSSDLVEDIEKAKKLGAQGYVVKTSVRQTVARIMELIGNLTPPP
jgi:two-component system, response regulator